MTRDKFTDLIALAISDDHTIEQRLAGVEILGMYDRLTALNAQLLEALKLYGSKRSWEYDRRTGRCWWGYATSEPYEHAEAAIRAAEEKQDA